MTGRDLNQDRGHDHSAHEGHETGHAGRGGHHWMMIACCIPMIVIVLALVATGTISAGSIIFAVACVGMMALMMRAMGHGSGPGSTWVARSGGKTTRDT